MDIFTVLNCKNILKLRFISNSFAIVVNDMTNEYHNVYTNEKGIELLKNNLIPHPKFEV